MLVLIHTELYTYEVRLCRIASCRPSIVFTTETGRQTRPRRNRIFVRIGTEPERQISHRNRQKEANGHLRGYCGKVWLREKTQHAVRRRCKCDIAHGQTTRRMSNRFRDQLSSYHNASTYLIREAVCIIMFSFEEAQISITVGFILNCTYNNASDTPMTPVAFFKRCKLPFQFTSIIPRV